MEICWILWKTAGRGGYYPTKPISDTERDRSSSRCRRRWESQACPREALPDLVQEPGVAPGLRGAAGGAGDGGTGPWSRTAGPAGPETGPAIRAPRAGASWGSETLPVLAASLRPKHPSSSELWGHRARPGQPGADLLWGHCSSQSPQHGTTQIPTALLRWGRWWGRLGALGRGPLQAAGIHGLVAVGPLGLLGNPLIDQVLGTAGDGQNYPWDNTAKGRVAHPLIPQNNSKVTAKQRQSESKIIPKLHQSHTEITPKSH